MGLTDKWAKNFEKITIVQPDWYVGYEDSTLFNAWMFNSMMRDCYHAAESHIEIAIRMAATAAAAADFRAAAADFPAAASAAEAAVLGNLWIKKTKNRFSDTLYGLSCHSYCISLCDIV